MYLNPVYIEEFKGKGNSIRKLECIFASLVNIMSPGTYVPLSIFVDTLFHELSIKQSLSERSRDTKRSKITNDLRRLGLIYVCDEELSPVPLYKNIQYKRRKYYIKLNDNISVNTIVERGWKNIVFETYITSNMIVNRYVKEYLRYYIEVSLDDAYHQLIKYVRETYEKDFKQSPDLVEKVVSQLSNIKSFKNKLIDPLEFLSEGIISFDKKHNRVLVDSESLEKYLAKEREIMISEFIRDLVKAYVQTLKDFYMYNAWKEGGLTYVSLMNVYQRFKETPTGRYIRSYNEFIQYCMRLANISERIKLLVHPRYIKSKDKGYNIYISRFLEHFLYRC